ANPPTNARLPLRTRMPRFAYPGTGSTLALLLWASALPAQTPAPAVRLIAHPAAVELDGPQARHRILVSAAAPDGSLVDVTGKSTFRSEQPAVVAVAADGECTARGDGAARVAITYNGQSLTVPVTVRRATEVRPPS